MSISARRLEPSRTPITTSDAGHFKIGIAIAGAVLVLIATLTAFRILGPSEKFSPPDITLQPNIESDAQIGTSFAVIGDYGTGDSNQYRVSHKLVEAYQQQPYSLLLTVGDNVYGADIVDRVSDVIDRPYGSLFDAGVKFRPILGNHDLDDGGEISSTVQTLGMPSRYYKFTEGPIEFFALDSNAMNLQQVAWLDQNLKCSEARWQVVYLHHPLYSSGRHGSNFQLRRKLENILVVGGAELVFAGHDHHYERTVPQFGVIHIVTGAAAKLRPVDTSRFTVVSESQLHFVRVDATESTMAVKAINVDGELIDEFSIAPRPAAESCG